MANEQICDQVDCNERATHAYTWEWGQTGVVCPKHQATLAQTAGNIGRAIHFSPIGDGAPPPLQRDERVKLKAEAMVANEELAEAKQRGLELYRQNTALIAQVQSLTVRAREQEAQLKDAVNARESMSERLAGLEAENAQFADELSRLRILVDLPPVDPRGETQPAVVE